MRKKIQHFKSFKSQAAFTMVELIIAISITLLLVGGGIAAFIEFNDKQAIRASAEELQIYLRTAQTKARLGERPAGCDHLNSYAVKATAGSNQISLVANCDSGEQAYDTYSFPSNISIQDELNVAFYSLHGGVSGAGTIRVIDGSGRTYSFDINQGGEITKGSLESS